MKKNAAACLDSGHGLQGSPGAGKPHAGKYSELTLSRQRGEGGFQSHSLTHSPYPPPLQVSAEWVREQAATKKLNNFPQRFNDAEGREMSNYA